jgi:hypothetical protein
MGRCTRRVFDKFVNRSTEKLQEPDDDQMKHEI